MTLIFVVCILLFAFAPFFLASPSRVIPTCGITKGKERLVANISDVPAWEEKGWKREDDPVPSDDPEMSLEEQIEKCRSFDSLADLVEDNGIDIDLSEIEKLADQKKAVLDALE